VKGLSERATHQPAPEPKLPKKRFGTYILVVN
jgi:hypothetical protein